VRRYEASRGLPQVVGADTLPPAVAARLRRAVAFWADLRVLTACPHLTGWFPAPVLCLIHPRHPVDCPDCHARHVANPRKGEIHNVCMLCLAPVEGRSLPIVGSWPARHADQRRTVAHLHVAGIDLCDQHWPRRPTSGPRTAVCGVADPGPIPVACDAPEGPERPSSGELSRVP
jgi:hypothetical protein